MKWAIVVVSPPGYIHSACFHEVAETLVAGLRQLGLEADMSLTGCLEGRQNLILGSNLLPQYDMYVPAGSILYNLEQVEGNDLWLNEKFLHLLKNNRVWDYSQANVLSLAKHGVSVEHVLPISYAPVLERIQHMPEKDIDVLFVGSMNDRRRLALEAIHSKGLRVGHLFGAYGKERDAFLGRSKILLNMHYYEAKILELVRISYYLANRCAVLSEMSANPDEDLVFAKGVEFCAYDELADRALMLCENADKRDSLAREGHRIMSSYKIEKYLQQALHFEPA